MCSTIWTMDMTTARRAGSNGMTLKSEFPGQSRIHPSSPNGIETRRASKSFSQNPAVGLRYNVLKIPRIFMKKSLKPKSFESRSYVELDELITRVLCDTAAPARIADAAYLFGETADNEASVLAAALLVWKLKRVKQIALPGGGEGAGYPGFDNWKEKLIK